MSAVEVARLDELVVDEARLVVIGKVSIALVLDSSGTVHAIGDRCSHGEVSLSDGFVEDGTLECWAHGARFDLATGWPLSLPAFEPVPVFQVTIEGGGVFVDPDVIIPTEKPQEA